MLEVVRRKSKALWRDEEGLGMLEMILIIAVIVIIAVIFRKQLKEIITNLLSKAATKTNEFMDDK